VSTSVDVYTPLAGGPQVPLTLPVPGQGACPCRVLVILTAQINGSTGNAAGFMSVQVDNGIAVDATSLRVAGNNAVRASATSLIPGLAAGPHTFTAVYKLVGSGTAFFAARTVTVIPG
jgi:hypothetical protein